MAGHLTHAGLRFSYHLAVADACQKYGLGDSLAFEHLKSAFRIGTPALRLRRPLLIRVSQAAVAEGDHALAVRVLEEFLTEFIRDSKANFLRNQYEV